MPRARSPNRRRAYELWTESGGKRELKDIAAELGVSPEQVRKWKHTDKWDPPEKTETKGPPEKAGAENPVKQERGQAAKDTLPKGKGNVTKRKRGGQPQNRNAVGNSGGAPVGNTNALIHGGYAKLYLDTLTEAEQAAIASQERDVETLLVGEIDFLSVREYRLMKRIQCLIPDEETEIITRLEDALTRCQAQKQRCIRNLMELRRDQAANMTEIEDMDSLEAEIYGRDSGDSGNTGGNDS